VRARLTFDGWYVRFMICPSESSAQNRQGAGEGKPAIMTDAGPVRRMSLRAAVKPPADSPSWAIGKLNFWVLSRLWISGSSV
jgi:hypothetical protein